MLLIVSSVFLICNIPSHAIRVYDFISSLVQPLVGPPFLLLLLQKLAMLLYYAGFATNFILYNISGRTFRRAFVRMWCCFGHRVSTYFYSKYVKIRKRSNSHGMTEIQLRLKIPDNCAYN